MTAAAIVEAARLVGVALAVRDGQIVARPRGALPVVVLESIPGRRAALVALLVGETAVVLAPDPALESPRIMVVAEIVSEAEWSAAYRRCWGTEPPPLEEVSNE